MTATTADNLLIFRSLCTLTNGNFNHAPGAATFAAWVGLRAELAALGNVCVWIDSPREDLRGTYWMPGMVALIDRVTHVARAA